MTSIGLLLFGLAVGVLSGILGIGGGILFVPGLMLLFKFSQAEAQGTSLAVLIPPIGLFAALVYYQNGYVRLPVVGLIAVGFVVGAFFGAKLVPHIPVGVMRVGFGALLLYVGFTFVFDVRATRWATALPAGLAALSATIALRLLGRRLRRPAAMPPPSDRLDYHI